MTALLPTQSLAQVAATSWDVIVIGAGCAGAIAARESARRGLRVLLADKARFPRYKVCGCCINRPAQNALASIGLRDVLSTEGAVTATAFDVRSRKNRAMLPLPGYAILSRDRFDAALVREAIAEGTAFIQGAYASLLSVSDTERRIQLRREIESVDVDARIVIVADGLGSRLLRATDAFDSPPTATSRIGLGAVSTADSPDYRAGVIYMACAARGYVGACRREDGHLTLAAACDAAFVKSSGGLARAAESILRDAGFPEITDINRILWKGTPELTRSATIVAAHRAFVAGDAAGYVEPFTGEGMKWAIESAIALAPIVAKAVKNHDARYEQEWIATRQRIVARRATVCRMLAASLRYPALVNTAVRILAVAPAVAALFVRSLNAPLPAQKEVVL